MKNNMPSQKKIEQLKFELKTKDRILASIHNISQLLTRSISLDMILNAIVKETRSIFGLQRVALFLIKRDAGLLECKYIVGFNYEETQRALNFPLDLERHRCRETLAVRTGKTIFIKDAQTDPQITETDRKMDRYWKRVSTITAPLKIRKDIIGVLEGDRTYETLDLSKAEIKLFSIFANQASIIIENARLNEQNQKKIKQLLYLQEIVKNTSSVLDYRTLQNIITGSAMNITKSTASYIFLKHRDGLKMAAYKGPAKAGRKKFHLETGQGLIGYAAEHETPILANDVTSDDRYVELVPGVRSQISVPLAGGDKVAGVLTVVSDKPGAFSPDDMSLFTLLAGHVSVILKNVNLYEQIIQERNIAENILESSPNGIITLDIRRRIISINRKAEEILDLSRWHLLGKRMEYVLQEDIVRAIHSDKETETEVRIKSREGGVLILGVSHTSLRTNERNSAGTLISIQDLTEGKKTEEFIRRMDRLLSLGQLSAGIAHEIRNPLASINFNVQMLAKKIVGQKEQSIVNDTLIGIERIKNLVKGILDFAKPGIPALSRGNINGAILDAVILMDLHFKKKKIIVKLELGRDIPEIIFDPQQIQQVFVNIVINAVEAMPQGGRLFIRSALENEEGDSGRRILVSVRDNGCGIADPHVARIFDPFFTTKAEGTGLGLSIVHKILDQHNAAIDVVSREGEGAEFLIKFNTNRELANVPL
ncbi:MAG: GAF domain-containing protein [Syntrophaceae bacterium]|nr:GAF domain-containing protein [Syntrophaceae bacterium]